MCTAQARDDLALAQAVAGGACVAGLSPVAPPGAVVMIAARKIAPFNFVVRRWLAGTLKRRFHGVYVFGQENLLGLDLQTAVVGCVNHTNWWDGFVLYVLSWRLFPHDIYLAMEEKNLRRYRFFTWMGTFGLDLADRHSALAGMRYALRLLKPGRLIWIFVQGRLLAAGAPIEVKPGALFLARRNHAQILPVVLRYEWLSESRPSVMIAIGAPLVATTTAEQLATVLDHLYAHLGQKLDPLDLQDAQALFPPRMSVNKRWDYFLHLLGYRRQELIRPAKPLIFRMNWLLVYHLAVTAFLLLVTLNIALNWRVFVAPRPHTFGPGGGDAARFGARARRATRLVGSCPACARSGGRIIPITRFWCLTTTRKTPRPSVVLDLGFSREKTGDRRLMEGRDAAGGLDGKVVGLPSASGSGAEENISCSPTPTPSMSPWRWERAWRTPGRRGRLCSRRGRVR